MAIRSVLRPWPSVPGKDEKAFSFSHAKYHIKIILVWVHRIFKIKIYPKQEILFRRFFGATRIMFSVKIVKCTKKFISNIIICFPQIIILIMMLWSYRWILWWCHLFCLSWLPQKILLQNLDNQVKDSCLAFSDLTQKNWE